MDLKKKKKARTWLYVVYKKTTLWKESNRLEVKGGRKRYHTNTNQKKLGVSYISVRESNL